MNLDQFTIDAKRTESVPEKINTNDVIFESLQSTMINLMDCFDLIKKNAFYDKPIDVDRFMARLTIAAHAIADLKNRCDANRHFVTASTAVTIDPREFHGILGILTEAGELLELVNLHQENIDPVKIADELGDAFWYIAILADSKNLNIEDQILEGVIAKLRSRFPDKFDSALAVVRDKEEEIKETTAAVTGITDVKSEVVATTSKKPTVKKTPTKRKTTTKKTPTKRKTTTKKTPVKKTTNATTTENKTTKE